MNIKPRHHVEQPSDPLVRLIPLTRGQTAIVDTADYEHLSQFKWHAQWTPQTNAFYAATYINGRLVHMQRYLVGGNSPAVDHANRNTLDNRRCNLRPCSHSQNQGNSKLPRHNKSGFKGIYWYPPGKCWRVKLGRKQIAACKDKETAARLYDTAALKRWGPFAYLNFPPK